MKHQFNGVIKGVPASFDGYAISIEALQWMVRIRKALVNDDWQTLETLANQGIGKAYGVYREMIRTLGVTHQLNQEANLLQATLLKSHASDKNTRKEFFREAKKKLLEIQPDI